MTQKSEQQLYEMYLKNGNTQLSSVEYLARIKEFMEFEIINGRLPIPSFAYRTFQPPNDKCLDSDEFLHLTSKFERAFGNFVTGFTYSGFVAQLVEQFRTPCCTERSNFQCLACLEQLSPEFFCRISPDQCFSKNSGRVCCKALLPKCMACLEGTTEDEYCSRNPGKNGCSCPEMCCEALTPSCLACSKCMTESEYCMQNPDKWGCPSLSKKPVQSPVEPVIACCQALTAECMACSEGVTQEDFC